MQNQKVAVVTGASSGIGKAIAETLAQQNYQVVNADLHPLAKQELIDTVTCDITSAGDMDTLYTYVMENYGVPQVLISNAGQGIHEKLSEGDPEKWKQVIDTNLMGTLRFIRAFLPSMLEHEKGSIVFVSSTAGHQAYEYGAVYSATKAALNMVAKTLRLETAERLRVFSVCPGVVDTGFFKNMIGSNHTVKDIGWGSLSPRQVADTVLYLLQLPPSVNIPEVTIVPVKQVL